MAVTYQNQSEVAELIAAARCFFPGVALID